VLLFIVLVAATKHATSRTALAQEMEVIAAGEIEYRRHCASCHGVDAKGKGPVAKFLNVPPSDLSQLAKRNAGRFPFWEVYRIIDGREGIRGHGTREMPVWGDRFLAEAQGKDKYLQTEAAGRILGLVFYLQHLQQ
jgi:mono/diheme cytochrome c family protein